MSVLRTVGPTVLAVHIIPALLFQLSKVGILARAQLEPVFRVYQQCCDPQLLS